MSLTMLTAFKFVTGKRLPGDGSDCWIRNDKHFIRVGDIGRLLLHVWTRGLMLCFEKSSDESIIPGHEMSRTEEF